MLSNGTYWCRGCKLTYDDLHTGHIPVDMQELACEITPDDVGRFYTTLADAHALLQENNRLRAEVERLRADNQALLDAAEVQGEIVLKMAAEAAKGAADGRD